MRILRKTFFYGLFLALFAGLLIALGAGFYLWRVVHRPVPDSVTRTLIIPRGASVDRIAHLLQDHRVIPAWWTFSIQVRLRGQTTHLKAGEYRFDPGRSVQSVMEHLIRGDTVLHFLTIPEGLTSPQIVALLKAESKLTGSIVIPPPEGSLLPETYAFSRGAARQTIVDTMTEALDKSLKDLWVGRDPTMPLKTRKEVLILASIVEREAFIAAEQPRIAAVFLNRLGKGMPLQSDPTVIYGLARKNAAPLGRPLSRADLKIATPFNTYLIPGLPPTPICHPGLGAIRAVLHPMKTDELYFVADGSGGHAFAKTAKHHRQNHAKWRQIRNKIQQKLRQEAKSAKSAKEAEKEKGET